MSRFTEITDLVWRDLAKQSETLQGVSPPVDLEQYATYLGIQHVRFKPLLSDAGLMVNRKYYEVIVNTEFPGETRADGSIASVGDGTWATFSSWLRRTVTHELSHLALIRAAERVPRGGSLLEQNHSDVEKACH